MTLPDTEPIPQPSTAVISEVLPSSAPVECLVKCMQMLELVCSETNKSCSVQWDLLTEKRAVLPREYATCSGCFLSIYMGNTLNGDSLLNGEVCLSKAQVWQSESVLGIGAACLSLTPRLCST